MQLGCIADDFTGATDLAGTLVKSGMSAVQLIGVPEGNIPLVEADAGVVALKSRTIPAAEAVAHSIAALDWLRDQGVRSSFSSIARLSTRRTTAISGLLQTP